MLAFLMDMAANGAIQAVACCGLPVGSTNRRPLLLAPRLIRSLAAWRVASSVACERLFTEEAQQLP
jgi:hypothetical protein